MLVVLLLDKKLMWTNLTLSLVLPLHVCLNIKSESLSNDGKERCMDVFWGLESQGCLWFYIGRGDRQDYELKVEDFIPRG